MGKIKDNWQIVVFTMILTIIGNIAFSSFTSSKNDIKNAASKDYVDMNDDKIIRNMNKADDNLQTQINKKADKDDVQKVIDDVNYTRDKVDKIYLLLIKNK